ncbi:hypothetical protein NA56DRAFT_699459 [Hyaloscypha hepaticicola]|uniref:Uncharacterized protein n=1 Tax=Hyaloscypha hepaticicola TaxID=2082293 RepID=A0A2J6QGZ9_9HELO|nr:hypothetical protein NA56DRAFT_699459 [Hyaloscypha hepaticicola]
MSETNLHSPRQLRQQFSCARSPGGFALLPASDRAAKFDPAYTARRQIAGTALANGSSSLRDGNFDGVVCVAGIGFDQFESCDAGAVTANGYCVLRDGKLLAHLHSPVGTFYVRQHLVLLILCRIGFLAF